MKFRKRSQKKTYILPTIFSIMVMLMVLASCSVEGSVYRIQYPKFSFQPYSFPLGDESAYAEVTFLTSYDTDFPKVVEINGNIYYVAVFNGYKENVDLSQITTINVDDCIQAINSHAYEHATNVTTLSIPNVLSLGDASLPENLTTLTVNAEAIDTVGTRPLNISLPNPDKLESLTITGKTRYSIDLSCIGGENSSRKEITMDADVPWPTMPHPTREGMKFIGWFTSDPSVDPDAKYAEAGKKPSTYPITVYPYFTPGIDEPETEPEKPTISIPALNIIKIYVYGMDKEDVVVSKNKDGRYVIDISAPDTWYCEWTRNGDIDLSTSSLSYIVDEEGFPGRLQIIGYIHNGDDQVVAAVLFELRG